MTLPTFTGVGYLAGEAPEGLTTVVGVPVSATVQVLWRDPDTDEEHLVASTTSAANGTWLVTDLNHELEFLVRGIKDGWNDVTVVGVSPVRTDEITFTNLLEPNADFDGLAGYVHLDSGLPPFSVSVVDPLPYGLEPVINGRKLYIEGTSDDDGVWESTVRVTASNSVHVDVPIQVLIGLSEPVLTTRYAVAEDWQITLDISGVPPFADGLRIYRDTSPIDPGNLPEPIDTIDASEPEWTDEDIDPGETYFYRVEVYVGGVGRFGEEVSRKAQWTPLDMPVKPDVMLAWGLPVIGSGTAETWQDESGNGFHFTAPGSTNRPAISKLLPVDTLVFDGVNDVMGSSNATLMAKTRAVGAVWQMVVVRPISGSGNRFVSNILGGTGLVRQATYYNYDTERFLISSRRADADSARNVTTSGTYANGQLHSLLVTRGYSAGTEAIYVDGALDSSTSGIAGGVTSNTNSSGYSLGAFSTGQPTNQSGNVELAAAVFGSGSVPTTQEIARLFGWAHHVLGIADRLPEEHPYKDTPP